MKQDIAHKFWKKYVNADILKRDEILKKMVKFGLWQEILNMSKIKSKKKIDGLSIQEYALKTNLMSYLGDLIDYLQSDEF